MSREKRVAEFYEAAGVNPTGNLPLFIGNFSEELVEFNQAMADHFVDTSEEARAAMIKEWADVQYTLSAFPLYFGFDGEEAFRRVADNNMSKVGPDGKVVKNEDGKIIKPEGYQKPDMKGL